MKTVINQRIVLAKWPVGEPKHSDFRIEQVELNELKQGEILLKTIYLSLDPYMRGRMSDAPSYTAPVEIGEVEQSVKWWPLKTQNSKKASGFFQEMAGRATQFLMGQHVKA